MSIYCKIVQNKNMGYFNYHAKAKNLIKKGDLEFYKYVENYNGISPALVLFFKNNRPMPIRKHKWIEYKDLIDQFYKEDIQ